MSGPTIAILLTVVIHLGGLVFLIWAMGGDVVDVFRAGGGSSGGGGGRPPADPSPAPSRGDGGLPLPDAAPSPVRLREPGRIADRYERPARRPAREPARTPERV